jgi:Fe-S cluster assembly protein SufD
MARDVRAGSAVEAALAREFSARRSPRPDAGAFAGLRTAAFARFEREGLPNRRVEPWKYTDLRVLMRDAKPLSAPPGETEKIAAKTAGAIAAGIPAHRIVFVDGIHVPELSETALEPGLTVESLAAAIAAGDGDVAARVAAAASLAQDDSALALNTAMMGDGAIIRVAKGAEIVRPVHLVFVRSQSAETATFTRSQVVVGPGAHAMFVESHEGPDHTAYQVNNAIDLVIGDGAHVSHVKTAGEGDGALHVATMTATIGAHAQFTSFGFTLGGGVTRNQAFVLCGGEQAEVTFAGAALLRSRSHADTTVMLDHAAGGCRSREVFKSVLEDHARGVYQGKIVVRPDAQKTDARMLMQALLLSEYAEADHKPELEIFADDVQCGHGSTAGALDENLKFYLMARGISEKEAELLLVQAFIAEAIETVKHEGLRDALTFAAVRWLGARP